MRIAIAEASPGVVAAIASVLDAVPGWEVAWSARDAETAIGRCLAEPPDVLLLAVDLPGAGAAAVTRRILQGSPCAIVLLVDGERDRSGAVLDALAAGALDRTSVPWVGKDGRLEGSDDLVRKVRVAARAGCREFAERPRSRHEAAARPQLPRLVVVGASTGGPAALATVLGALPSRFPAAVVVVQHVDARFSANLATWLGGEISLPVRVVRAGDAPVAGTVLLAVGDEDLVVLRDLTLVYARPVPGDFFHPSVDVFFRSLAEHWPQPGIAALLTGMGRDGAEGLLALRKRGWRTLAQDETTSAVYGMPKAAAILKAPDEVLPVQTIGPTIVRFVTRMSGQKRGAH